MSNQNSKYKIMADQVDIYNAVKHKLPCWNCLVRSTCFSEKKATKRAKYLRYTLNFNNPCIELILSLNLLHLNVNLADTVFIRLLERTDRFDIPKLFDDAVDLYNSNMPESKNLGFASFIRVVQRDPTYIRLGDYTAYHYLGYIFHETIKNIDLAIELYSKGIELTPKEPSIIENRGFCFLKKNDLENALDDFERAEEIGDGCHPDLANIIDDIKNRQKGLRGSGIDYQSFINQPKTAYELFGFSPYEFDWTV